MGGTDPPFRPDAVFRPSARLVVPGGWRRRARRARLPHRSRLDAVAPRRVRLAIHLGILAGAAVPQHGDRDAQDAMARRHHRPARAAAPPPACAPRTAGAVLARVRRHPPAGALDRQRAGQRHLAHVDAARPRHGVQHRLRMPRLPPPPASVSLSLALPLPLAFVAMPAASALPARGRAPAALARGRGGEPPGRLLGPPRARDSFLRGLGSGSCRTHCGVRCGRLRLRSSAGFPDGIAKSTAVYAPAPVPASSQACAPHGLSSRGVGPPGARITVPVQSSPSEIRPNVFVVKGIRVLSQALPTQSLQSSAAPAWTSLDVLVR